MKEKNTNECNKAIGGYLEIELNHNHHDKPLFNEAVKLNTGRSCLRYIVRGRQIREIYVPSYTCPVVWDALSQEGCEMKYYSIDYNFLPSCELPKDAYILYTNYFGVCSDNVDSMAKKYSNLIVDNSQSFYGPHCGIASFNSARKFFGVPDGAYLFTDIRLSSEPEQDLSYSRCSHLLVRKDKGAQAGYELFLKNERILTDAGLKTMSSLSQSILDSIDTDHAADIRKNNFNILHNALNNVNEWNGRISENDVPMTYPFICRSNGFRQYLISKQIFIPTFWKGQKDLSAGQYFAEWLLPLPIDQRYSEQDMMIIIKEILTYLNK